MRFIMCGLVLAACLTAQVAKETEVRNNLASALTALGGSRDASQTAGLTAALLAVPEGAHQPKRESVTLFSRDLAASLAGRTVPRARATQLAAEIVIVLQSAGVATYKFKEASARFAVAIESLGVNSTASQRLTRMLAALGEQVRGPSDLHISASA